MKSHSLTKYYEGIALYIAPPIEIYNTFTGKMESTSGIWDTGADGSVITKSLHVRVHGVHGYQD
jgi:hypothetical protein